MSEDLDSRLFDEELSEEGRLQWLKADKLYEVGDFEGALRVYRSLLTMMPVKKSTSETNVRVRTSYCHEKLGNPEAALQQLFFAMDCHTEQCGEWCEAHVDVLLETAPQLEDAVRQHPKYSQILNWKEELGHSYAIHQARSNVFREKQEYDKATAEMRKAIELAFEESQARAGKLYWDLAEIQKDAGNIKGALESLDQGITLLESAQYDPDITKMISQNLRRQYVFLIESHPHVFGYDLDAKTITNVQGALIAWREQHPTIAVDKLQDAIIDVGRAAPLLQARMYAAIANAQSSLKNYERAGKAFEMARAFCSQSDSPYAKHFATYFAVESKNLQD